MSAHAWRFEPERRREESDERKRDDSEREESEDDSATLDLEDDVELADPIKEQEAPRASRPSSRALLRTALAVNGFSALTRARRRLCLEDLLSLSRAAVPGARFLDVGRTFQTPSILMDMDQLRS